MAKPALTRSPLAPVTMPDMPAIDGALLSVCESGTRYKNRPDLLLMSFPKGASVAGVLTRSKAPSAAVDWCRASLPKAIAMGCVVNAGNANAFTGKKGDEATAAMAQTTADLLVCKPQEIFLASTGIIGEPLPYEKLNACLPMLHESLHTDGWIDAARAIMTTDTFAKYATRSFMVGAEKIILNGIAKGSGMIAPDMATMLAFIATNANIKSSDLQAMLSRANEKSFNCTTVDGDTSTSDTALLFATAQSPATFDNVALQQFETALTELCSDLAEQIVRDGEGATKLVRIKVSGAENDNAAKRIGLSIANSPLVKTAIAGEDPNWGRIVMAVGKAGEKASRDTLSIAIGGVIIATDGMRVEGYDEAPVKAHMQGQLIHIDVDLHLGAGSAHIWTCDLTHSYIDINADYRS